RELATDAAVEDAARANAFDRYLAARLAPRAARRDLIALAAFVGDTARIAATASEPLIGEIRLQWWRDVLEPGPAEGEATAVPLMLEARQRSPRAHLVNDWAELAPAILNGARSSLQQVRRSSRAAPESANAAILPTALVEPYLAALEKLGPGIVRERADISP